MFNSVSYSESNYLTATYYFLPSELKEIVEGSIFIDYPGIDTDSDGDIKNVLINAAQVIDSIFEYDGDDQALDQRLTFPRDFDPEWTITDPIKLAIAYIAGIIKQGKIDTILVPTSGKDVKKEKADVLEIEYFEGGSDKPASFAANPFLEMCLSDYLNGSQVIGLNNSFNISVTRTL